MNLRQFPQVFLRGLGQIMLQPCVVTGLLFLVGIAVGSPLQMASALLGSVIGYVYGALFVRKSEWLSDGLFGFNPALVGIAISVTFEPSWSALALVATGSLAASAVMHLFLLRGLPAYTAPFVLASWLVVAVGKHGLHLYQPTAKVSAQLLGDLPGAPLAGIGQVMFQDEALSGLLFLLGVTLCPIIVQGWQAGKVQAFRQGAWTFVGAWVAGFFALAMGEQHSVVDAGLFGFNGALAALAVSMNRKEWWAPLVFALLTVPLMMAFRAVEVPALTAPFVLSTWLSHGVFRKES
jgi:urea transporter